MNTDAMPALKTALRLFISLLKLAGCLAPCALQFGAYLMLPSLHRVLRDALDPLWTYHIADSGVTVGLAYYAGLAFLLWQTRLLGWKFTNYLLDELGENIWPANETNAGAPGDGGRAPFYLFKPDGRAKAVTPAQDGGVEDFMV